jgi:hypothetical protein
MASDNKLELVVEVDAGKANASIKSINTGLSGMEQAAAKASRGAASGVDAMTMSMVKGATAGNLLADALKTAVAWAKQWTIGAVEYAAHSAKILASTRAMGQAHGYSAQQVAFWIEQVKKVGYSTQEAAHTINRLMIAEMDLSKATGLSKLAKDAAAIENIGADEAMEKLLLAVEGGVSRGLRSMGLFLDFQKEVQVQELTLGRTLSENEALQLRYNAVMREGSKIAGAHAAASGEAEAQVKKFKREMMELREAIGQRFQDQYRSLTSHLTDLATWLRNNIDLLEKFAAMAVAVAGSLALVKLGSKIADIGTAVSGLSALLKANPVTVGLLLAAGGAAAMYTTYKQQQERVDSGYEQAKNSALRRDVMSGKVSIDSLRKQGMTDDQIRSLVSGKQAFGAGDIDVSGLPKVTTGPAGPSLEALKMGAEMRKRQLEVEREAAGAAGQAGARGRLGFGKDIAEMNEQLRKWTTFTDERGGEHRIALTRDAWVSVIDQLEKRWGAFKRALFEDNKKHIAEYLKDEEEAARKVMEWDAERYQRRIQNDADVSERNVTHLRDVRAFEEQIAGFRRDARVRGVEALDAQTLPQKIAVEKQKADIEIEYLQKVHEVRQALYDMDTRKMLLDEELTLKRLGYRADDIKARVDELKGQRDEIRSQADTAQGAAVQAARENASNRAAELVRDHNRQIFDSLKQQAGGVFDALLTKSQSVWSAIASSFKTAVLTAIKEIVTSRVAAMLMQMFTGQRVGFASGGGIMGGLGGGTVPVFGSMSSGAGSMGSAGIAAATGMLGAGSMYGAGAGVPGLAVLPGMMGAGQQRSPVSGLAANLAGLKSFLGFGSMSKDSLGGSWATVGNQSINVSSMGGKLTALGKSDAAAMGGAMLAMDGLRRGGVLGLGETTAGGAMIGFKYGGGLGAAIGAGIGAAAGIARLFIKGAQEKAREKIKSVYGVDISDKGILAQIVQMAKQSYGGNIDLAIRSQQVRDLIEGYARMTGQAVGIQDRMRGVSLSQAGGTVLQTPIYENGRALAYSGSIGVAGKAETIPAAGGGQVVMPVIIDNREVGRAVMGDGGFAAAGVVRGMRASAGRFDLASAALSPGLIRG